MKKKLCILAGCVCLLLGLTSCDDNVNLEDLFNSGNENNLLYTKAMIKLPNGKIIEGEIEEWEYYSDNENLIIRMDGHTYLVNSNNAVLYSETWPEEDSVNFK